ncbi:MAG: DegT/DnrJ/EryC1/StrS aminotransferase family protein [Lachnospiraceae bacterium]|nr:DegT/DnrJ/EryC1/StrS aminotransferase family protein [Lachnospiraceae bacterium]
MDYIVQMKPSFDENERSAMNEYMSSDAWLMEFKKTREFEQMIAQYTGAKYCSIMPNGTLSLSVALLACGVTKNDEVLVPNYTMVATPNSVELIGAKAVFVDIERHTLCMDFEKMREAVTDKTKAIILVSINGRYPEKIEEIVQYCHEKNIYVIEDAAQSLGSFYGERHVGKYGDVASFSFSVPKIITTGQGGALITDNEALYKKILLIRDFGREKSGEDHYLVKGWNFKFTDLQAVIGIEQMKKLSDRVLKKRKMGEIYYNNLQNINGVELIETNLEETTPWFYDILCDRREELIEFLHEHGVGSRRFYPPLHSEPAYEVEGEYPITEEISRKGLWLPSWIGLEESQITMICRLIRQFYEND